jgi:hypothetical protein
MHQPWLFSVLLFGEQKATSIDEVLRTLTHFFTKWTVTSDLSLCAGHYLLFAATLWSRDHRPHFIQNRSLGLQG